MERITTIALVLVLFDGGMHIGWSRFRAAAVPIVTVGVVGTFLTAAGAAVVVHPTIRVSWYLELLVATAVAPTIPQWCSPCWAVARSPAAAAPSWKASPAPTIQSVSP